MDLMTILIVVLPLALVAALAQIYGADSRPWDTRDNPRPWL
jgi:hypothetical protein